MAGQRFVIFSGSIDDQPLWQDSAEGLGAARARMKEMAQNRPGRYFVYSLTEHKLLDGIDTTPRVLDHTSSDTAPNCKPFRDSQSSTAWARSCLRDFLNVQLDTVRIFVGLAMKERRPDVRTRYTRHAHKAYEAALQLASSGREDENDKAEEALRNLKMKLEYLERSDASLESDSLAAKVQRFTFGCTRCRAAAKQMLELNRKLMRLAPRPQSQTAALDKSI